jgi:Flp pilus assembly protein TadD
MLATMAVLFASCNCYNRLSRKAKNIEVTATPQVLVVKGGNITTDVTVKFPADYVRENTIIRVTPVLEFEKGTLEGVAKFVQGEGVADNYTVIGKDGGSYTQTVTFPYTPDADISTLKLYFCSVCGCETEFLPLTTVTVAQGVSNIVRNADWTSFMELMPDNFKRVEVLTQEADLMYLINSSQVRNVALSAEQVKLFEQFVKDAEANELATLASVQARGYASPDGPQKFNDKLAGARSSSAKTAVGKQLKGVAIEATPYGEDWDGFKKLVEASNIEDKDLILSVLNMYSSPVQREEQIKNMSQVYGELKKDVLPKLRRAQLVANADIKGKTDAELVDAVEKNVNSLNVEEMLFAAKLVGNNEAVRVYKAAADKYNDVRAVNNMGVALARMGEYTKATEAFNTAAKMSSAPEISNNLGVMALLSGDAAEANRYVASLSGSNAKANQGLVALVQGDYATAARNLNGYNLAVAELANGNVSASKAALGNTDTAQADYVRGIIAMREGNHTQALSNLNKAFAKDPSLKERAKSDIEFYAIRGQF